MAAVLQCIGLRKRYGSTYSLGRDDLGVDLTVERGEIVAVIGPSGCGKSTLLRIVGGFVEPSGGDVVINGRQVTQVPPNRRPTNMVFQNYALFPHLTIFDNVSFGLEMERVANPERAERVGAVLRAVGLDHLAHRYVSELSGGQLQRAALARALVKRPAVVLLDEPLGALDLKLRREMQDEILRLKDEFGMTILHVTHDQEEACAIADQIAVMKEGMVLQVDRPAALYARPRTAFVAEFIGAGKIVRGDVDHVGGETRLRARGVTLVGPASSDRANAVAGLLSRRGVSVSVAEASDDPGPNAVIGSVVRLAFGGVDYSAQVRVNDDLVVPIQLSLEQVNDMGVGVGTVLRIGWTQQGVGFVVDDGMAPSPGTTALIE